MTADLPTRVATLVDGLAADPRVAGVRLGGSRGSRSGPPSENRTRDWDLLVYLDGEVHDLSAPGLVDVTPVVSPFVVGEATVEDADGIIDLAFVDVAAVAGSVERSAAGNFRLHPMVRSVAGTPSYVVEAEVALSRPLAGAIEVPPVPPGALVSTGVPWWRGRAALAVHLAQESLRIGDEATTAGFVAAAAASLAHADALKRGWYLPSKRFVARSRDPVLAAALQAAVALDPTAAAERLQEFGAAHGLAEDVALRWAADGQEEGP